MIFAEDSDSCDEDGSDSGFKTPTHESSSEDSDSCDEDDSDSYSADISSSEDSDSSDTKKRALISSKKTLYRYNITEVLSVRRRLFC